MKPKILLSILAATFATTELEFSLAAVKFADERTEEDIQHLCERYPLIKKQFDKLSSSIFTYVIRYKHDEKEYDAIFETDGQHLLLTFMEKKGISYSLQVRFAHEATHALQFERGQIGFIRNKDGDWGAVNIDLWDEAEAFTNSLEVADIEDLCLGKLGMFRWKYETEGYQKAATWLKSLYPGLSIIRKNNPDINNLEAVNRFYVRRGCRLFCKAGQTTNMPQLGNEAGNL